MDGLLIEDRTWDPFVLLAAKVGRLKVCQLGIAGTPVPIQTCTFDGVHFGTLHVSLQSLHHYDDTDFATLASYWCRAERILVYKEDQVTDFSIR